LLGKDIFQGKAQASGTPGGMFPAELDDPFKQRLMVRWSLAATAIVVGDEFGRAGRGGPALDHMAHRMDREVQVGGNLVNVLALVVTTQDGVAEWHSKGSWHGNPPEKVVPKSRASPFREHRLARAG